MKDFLSAEKYRIPGYRILTAEIFCLMAVSLFFSFKQYPIFHKYLYMAPFFASFLMCYVYMIGFAVLIGFLVGEDFQNGCVAAVLARNCRRGRYYLGKLISQFFICGGLFLLSVIFYTFFRELTGHGDAYMVRDQYFLKLCAYLLISLLQILAISSVYTMLTFLIRRSAPAVSACMALVVVELLAKQLAGVFHLRLLEEAFFYTPFGILNRMNTFIIPDLYLEKEFWMLCFPALIIIIASSAAGILFFRSVDL